MKFTVLYILSFSLSHTFTALSFDYKNKIFCECGKVSRSYNTCCMHVVPHLRIERENARNTCCCSSQNHSLSRFFFLECFFGSVPLSLTHSLDTLILLSCVTVASVNFFLMRFSLYEN